MPLTTTTTTTTTTITLKKVLTKPTVAPPPLRSTSSPSAMQNSNVSAASLRICAQRFPCPPKPPARSLSFPRRCASFCFLLTYSPCPFLRLTFYVTSQTSWGIRIRTPSTSTASSSLTRMWTSYVTRARCHVITASIAAHAIPSP